MTGDDVPGTATVIREADGTRTVVRAADLIRVTGTVLDTILADGVEPDGWLQLDSAGEYRYRYVRTLTCADCNSPHVPGRKPHWMWHDRTEVYVRVTAEPPQVEPPPDELPA